MTELSTMSRRSIVLGAAVSMSPPFALAAPILAIPPSGRLSFKILRQGSQIGEHLTTFDRSGDMVTVRSVAEIVVYAIGIPVFRYTHQSVERWQGGSFMSLESKTNDDGKHYRVSARREANGLEVTASAWPRYVAPAEALPMTHWNRTEVSVPKINPQKGDLLRPVVTDRGTDRVAIASGGSIAARHYNFSGQAILDIWFDTNGQWAALAFLGGDQSQIALERREYLS